MSTYLALATTTLTTLMADARYAEIFPVGTYARGASSLSVHVHFESAHHRPDLEIAWLAEDRMATLLQVALGALGTPQFQDLLTVNGQRYQVQRAWETAPGLAWSMQVRPWN